MNITIFLHSTTGNTRLVTRYAVHRLEAAGHQCHIHNIVACPTPPTLEGVDLLGVACPTMYFRPTFAMEQFVARLLDHSSRRPAFLLATAAGEPGAHFALLAEQLATKGWCVRGAHWVIAPSNWPPHLRLIRHLGPTLPLGRLLARSTPRLRPLWGILWPEACTPDERDRERLDRFLDEIMRRTEAGWPGPPPRPTELHRPMPTFETQGRMIRSDLPDRIVHPRVDAAACSRCGTCVAVCPVQIITRDGEDQIPTIRRGCTGCFACFNHCPDGAISAVGADSARYLAPPADMRSVFGASGHQPTTVREDPA